MRLLVVTQAVDSDHSALGFFVDWLHALAARCDEVQVICVSEGRHDLPANVYVHTIGNRKEAGIARRLFRYWKHLHSLTARCDRVFLHMCPEYAVAGAPFFLATRKSVILWYTHASVTWKLRIAVRIVDRVCTATKESMTLRTTKKRVLGHGIPATRFADREREPSAALRLLAVGRVSPVKGLETLVRAVAHLRSEASMVTLDIVGTASRPEDRRYRQHLDALIETQGLNGYVRFLGAVAYEALPRLYAEHDRLVHDARGGLDKVLLEAMASGMPVYTSNPNADFLPETHRFPAGDHRALARTIANDPGWDEARWKSYVAETHSLGKLAERVCQEHL